MAQNASDSAAATKKTKRSAADTPPWELDVQFLKGVGAKLGEIFRNADVRTLWDLLLFLPRTYEDRRKFYTYTEMLASLEKGDSVVAHGVIERFDRRPGNTRGGPIAEAWVNLPDEPGRTVLFTFFYDPGQGVSKRFPPGTAIVFRGKAQVFKNRLQFVHPEIQKADTDEKLPWWEFGGFIPVYKEISGLSTRVIRRIVAQALERPELSAIEESLPEDITKRLGLPSLLESLKELHFPKRWEPKPNEGPSNTPFYQRVAFEELFMMALALQMRRTEWMHSFEERQKDVPLIEKTVKDLEKYTKTLPYKLTGDQVAALKDVLEDLALKKHHAPMHRLVQGDVGSGKTIVAFLAALLVVDSGFQAAFMAPTEILADQHYQNFIKLFPERAHEAMLLKGALTEKKKKEVRAKIASGELRFAIGTQALLTHDTLFEKLALVIVDEQHRFGVRQRLKLKDQSTEVSPHLLVMTATPIPRSLALTIYGDLSLTLIREKPVGRIPIETHLIKQKSTEALKKRLKTFVDEGRQIYMVYPLVEESDEIDLKDVTNAYKDWCVIFGEDKVGLLHGKLKSAQKDEIMRAFKSGEKRVLVATTVIEVGVDVPNASVIVIEHAERFGLSQLHQLRGRVGRGAEKSLCVLVGPDRPSPLVDERLQTMVQSEDGFYIAEKDLEIRGPGEFLGKRQSGMPGFRVAHILRDVKLLEHARDEAQEILIKDPQLLQKQNIQLKRMIERWWADRMELTLSG